MNVEGIHIGSGPHYAEGWWNIDALPPEAGTQPDELMDLFDLPTRYPATFNKAYIGHVLEHIEPEQVVDAVNAVAACVKPGGQVMVVGPCYDKAVAQDAPEWLLEAIRVNAGEYEHHPWGHSWTATETLTLAYMQASVLRDVTVVNIQHVTWPEWCNPSTAAWQTAIVGTAP
jgi:predicted SAM-dependent methyltransferase